MHTLFKTLTLAVALLAMLTACGQLGSPSGPKTFQSRGNILSVQAPGQWIDYDLHDDADLEIAHGSKELYVLLLSEPAMDFAGSLQEYSDDTRQWIHESVTNMSESGPRSMTINGHPAVQYTVRGTIDGINIVYLHTIIQTDEYFHQFAAWATASEFGRSESVLQDIVKSAQETASAPAETPDEEDGEGDESGEPADSDLETAE